MHVPAISAALFQDLLRNLQLSQLGEGPQRAPLTVGEILPGRIGLDVLGARTLLIAGVQVPATLPDDLQPGQVVRLQVTESTGLRLVLQVVPDAQAAPGAGPAQQQQAQAAGALPYAAIPIPGGGQARVWLDSEADQAAGSGPGGPARSHTMVVRYDSQALGRLDVVLRLDAECLEATLLAPPGESVARLRSAVPELRAALAAATDRPVSVSTGGRTGKDADVLA